MPIPSLRASSRLTAAPDQVSCDLAGEAALLHLKTGVYFGLNAVGARVWQLLQPATTFGALCDALEAEYAIDRARLESELAQLLGELSGHGLVEIG